MQDETKNTLSMIRLDHAKDCLKSSVELIKSGDYKSSANRSYYAVFHAMRAVLALDGIDSKKHSGIISEFRKLYIKTGIFDSTLSVIISELFDVRTNCDYDDFYLISKEETIAQSENANVFLEAIEAYLNNI